MRWEQDQNSDALPRNWAGARIGDVLSLANGFAFKPSHWQEEGLPIIRIQNLNKSNAPFNYSSAQLPDRFRVDTGDLLFAWSGTPGTSFGAHIWKGGTAWLNQHIFRVGFSRELFDIRFLQLAINQNLAEYIRAAHGGAGLAHITKGRFEESTLRLAPLNEQRRIVSEIDKQFSRLDDAVAALKRVQANLKRYRASVLKAACEGRLVPTEAELARKEGRSYEPAGELLKRILDERRAKWEADQLQKMIASRKPPKDDQWKEKYNQPEGPDTTVLPDLPDGWTWASLDQLAWASDYGTSEKCGYGTRGIPVLRIPNIAAGRIDLSDLKRTTKTETVDPVDAVSVGDILIIRTNGSRDLIGRSAVVSHQFDQPYLHASYLIRFRLLHYLKWLGLIWDAPDHRARIEANAATSAGQYNISMGELAQLPVPLPPGREADRICDELERRLSGLDATIRTAGQQLRHGETLRAAILKSAFSGTLVPQDPNDEPASVLLERIRAERAALATNNGNQKATPKARTANGQRRRRAGKLAQGVSPGKG